MTIVDSRTTKVLFTALLFALGLGFLYVARQTLIFVSDQLLTTTNAAAPWAKAGRVAVATGKPFLAGESAGTYVSWFNAPAGSQAVKSATNSGALEGTIDLIAAFGAMPTNIYLCAAAYVTADGGALGSQCPAGSGADIETTNSSLSRPPRSATTTAMECLTGLIRSLILLCTPCH